MTLEMTAPRGAGRRRHARTAAVAALLVATTATPHGLPAAEEPSAPAPPGGTILFSSLAPRGWDVYLTGSGTPQDRRLTDHPALDYNAAFSPDGQSVAFVSERDGNPELYAARRDGTGLKRLTNDFALDDHPAWSPDGKRIAFCSTRQPNSTPGRAWNAIYVMNADGTGLERVSPEDAVDYSPTWSPQGDWIACASGSGSPGGTDLYVMRPDGSERKLVIKDAGWPAFAADGASIFFHRRHSGKWGIWHVKLDGSDLQRVTPEDVEAFTPRASVDGRWLVAAVLRDEHRQIGRLDLDTHELTPVTSEPADHWNPSISPSGEILYHRAAPGFSVPNAELWGSPPGCDFQMLRLAGAFPAPSHDGRRVALTMGNFTGFDIMNIDGSGRRSVFRSSPRTVFSLSWARTGDLIAFSHGRSFQGADFEVNIEIIAPDGSGHRTLTDKAGNNGFPSFSPNGEQLVFRSGRGGSKNLYIMNRDGTGVRRLTEGNWTDTMCDWSPTGDWIAFASDRDQDFEIWLIRPDGTGLKKLIGGGGRNNHPHFSPDGQWIVFTSQRAGLSAEEISLPRQPQPYGDLFAIRIDGTGLIRLTHNGYEEGTPAWGPATRVQPTRNGQQGGDDY